MIKKLLLLVLVFFPLISKAQNKADDKMVRESDRFISYEKSQISDLIELYKHETSPAFELINGREYYSYYSNSKFKPVLFSNKTHLSSVTVKGINYYGVPVSYDTFHDRVIYGPVSYHSNSFNVELNEGNIEGFTFYYADDTLSFRYFRKGEKSDSGLNDGFYEVAYDGKTKYMIKHRSIEYFNNSIPEYEYKPDSYLNLGNGYIKIRSKVQFCSLFGEKAPEVKKYLRDSGIKFKKANKRELNCVLKFYDHLTKNNN
jgi:hypothetical protein